MLHSVAGDALYRFAYAVNATVAGVLAEEAAKTGALLVHYSTDYVFGGCTAGALCRAGSGRAAVGVWTEQAGRRSGDPARLCAVYYLRTSWVFGTHGANFLKTILRLASERDGLAIVADQTGAPTSARLIADVTAVILRRYLRDQHAANAASLFGTYHLRRPAQRLGTATRNASCAQPRASAGRSEWDRSRFGRSPPPSIRCPRRAQQIPG